MSYKECILEMLEKIDDEELLKKIYSVVKVYYENTTKKEESE